MVDAGNSYFENNYDDCIRKIITSVENTFDKCRVKKNGEGFPDTLNRVLARNFIGTEAVRKNIAFIYRIRNKIVHDKLRIKYDQGWFCDRAMRTLFLFPSIYGEIPWYG